LTTPHADVKDGKRFNTPDTNFEDNRLPVGHGEEKRAFTYFVLVRSERGPDGRRARARLRSRRSRLALRQPVFFR